MTFTIDKIMNGFLVRPSEISRHETVSELWCFKTLKEATDFIHTHLKEKFKL